MYSRACSQLLLGRGDWTLNRSMDNITEALYFPTMPPLAGSVNGEHFAKHVPCFLGDQSV